MSHTKAALDAQRPTLEALAVEAEKSASVCESQTEGSFTAYRQRNEQDPDFSEEAWASREEKITVNVQGTWENGTSFDIDVSGKRYDVRNAIESLRATGNLQGELYITERRGKSGDR